MSGGVEAAGAGWAIGEGQRGSGGRRDVERRDRKTEFFFGVRRSKLGTRRTTCGGLRATNGRASAEQRLTALVILGFAAVQIVVHMVYFLHMNTKSEGGWNLVALVFTAVLVIIVLSGSLWVMHHLNTNMMPGPHEMQDMLRNAP